MTAECQATFEDLKQALQSTPIRTPPDFRKPFKVRTDASKVGLGAVLTQEHADGEDVVAYASKLLQGAETK